MGERRHSRRRVEVCGFPFDLRSEALASCEACQLCIFDGWRCLLAASKIRLQDRCQRDVGDWERNGTERRKGETAGIIVRPDASRSYGIKIPLTPNAA